MLAQRRDRAVRIVWRHRRQGPGEVEQCIDLDAGGDTLCGAIEHCIQIAMLAGLNQAQMSFRQAQPVFTRNATQHGNAERLDGAAEQVAMSATAYAVEDHPPTNWTVSEISEGGAYDSTTGKVKFGPDGQNLDADPVLLQWTGGKFVTIFPQSAAIAEAKWPMNA